MRAFPVAALLVLSAAGVTALWWSLRDEAREPEPSASAATPDETAARTEPELADPVANDSKREGIAARPATEDGAADVPGSLVRGRLSDSDTGEALGDYLLRFEDASGRTVDATTDAQGAFETPSRLAFGTLRVSFLDQPKRTPLVEPQELEHTPDDGDLQLRVASGPTFWLDLQPTRDVESLDLDVRLRYFDDTVRTTSELEPVRRASGAWVRFGALPATATASEAIEVRSRDGYWAGDAHVTAVKGRVLDAVAVKLDARAVLEVHVADDKGKPIDGASLIVDTTATGGKRSRASGRAGIDGNYRFEYLVAGDGTLGARSFFHAPLDQRVPLVAKQTSKTSVAMTPLEAAGAIRGRIASETGTYTPKVTVVIHAPPSASSNGRSPLPMEIVPAWEIVDGRAVATFAFDGLPKAEYRLDVRHQDDFFRWEPNRATLTPPSDAAVFLVHDGVANTALAFRVHDADSGLTVDRFRVSLDVRGGPSRSLVASSDQVMLEHVPADRQLTWRIDKEGYRPAFGDRSSFDRDSMRGDVKVKTAELNLEPGWGDVFRVVQSAPRNGPPIAGAHILLDGRDVGATGNDGTLRAYSRDKPTRVECTWRDWVVANKIDLAPPWARSDPHFIPIQMAPPKRK
jgi:hypothetical protein